MKTLILISDPHTPRPVSTKGSPVKNVQIKHLFDGQGFNFIVLETPFPYIHARVPFRLVHNGTPYGRHNRTTKTEYG